VDVDFDALLEEQLKRGKKEEKTETPQPQPQPQPQPVTQQVAETPKVETPAPKTDEVMEEFAKVIDAKPEVAQPEPQTQVSEPKPEVKPEPQPQLQPQPQRKTEVFDQVVTAADFSFTSFTQSDILEPDVAPPSAGKETILIAGEKNDGKSISALSFPGKIAVVAFDEKIFAARDFVVEHGIKREDEIMIYYPAKHYNPKAVDDREIGKAAIAVINEAFRAIYSIKVRAEAGTFVPDWILFDNLEFFIRLAEFAGKYKRGVPITVRPEKGDDVWGAFDIRNIITNVIYKAAISIPKKGVIYTLYTKEKEVVMPDGTTKKVKTPKWFEVLMYETDHHILVWKDGDRYFAKIVGTKNPKKYPDGLELEVTNVGFWNALQAATSQKQTNGEVRII